jgi:prolipoprotein diacylglyceryltransferase
MQQVLWRIPILQNWFPDGIPIYGFGMMLFLAFIACTWLGGCRAQRVGIAKEHIQDLAIWLFVGGLLGARITYLLQEQPRPTPVEFLKRLPQIWNGGIILYGSILGALAGYAGAWFFIFRKRHIPTLKLADVIAPSVALGLCLGRLGCFLNGCCYGQVACPDCAVYPRVHFPLSAPAREALVEEGYQTAAGFTLAERQPGDGARVGQVVPGSPAADSGLRPGDLIVGADGQDVKSPEDLNAYLGGLRNWPRGKTDLQLTVVHAGGERQELPPFSPRTLGLYPTQLYESVSMVLLLLLLLAYEPFRRAEGQVMALLMVGYAVHRYLNELLRDDPRPVGFERYASVFLFAAGLALWLWLQFRPRSARREGEKVVQGAAVAARA